MQQNVQHMHMACSEWRFLLWRWVHRACLCILIICMSVQLSLTLFTTIIMVRVHPPGRFRRWSGWPEDDGAKAMKKAKKAVAPPAPKVIKAMKKAKKALPKVM